MRLLFACLTRSTLETFIVNDAHNLCHFILILNYANLFSHLLIHSWVQDSALSNKMHQVGFTSGFPGAPPPPPSDSPWYNTSRVVRAVTLAYHSRTYFQPTFGVKPF